MAAQLEYSETSTDIPQPTILEDKFGSITAADRLPEIWSVVATDESELQLQASVRANSVSRPIAVSSEAGSTELVFPGTDIPVYRVAALLLGGKLTEREVAEDFPSLTRAQIREARKMGKANPNAAAQYPPRSLKRILASARFGTLRKR
jgi:uncharacterized protein (DUF433 family)